MANCVFGERTICPYYITETGNSISCENLTAQVDRTMMRFAGRGQKEAFQETHCATFAYEERCPLAAALRRKYEESVE